VRFPNRELSVVRGSKENVMHFGTRRFAEATALMLMLAGCGELADQDSKPPVLATLHGTLRLAPSEDVPRDNLRVALIWRLPTYEESNITCDGLESRPYIPATSASSGFEERLFFGDVQQAVEITPKFPSAFELELAEPPPLEALYDHSGGKLADGVLVVYRDGNGNNKLDSRADTSPSPDELLHSGSYFSITSDSPETSTRPSEYDVVYTDRPVKAGIGEPTDLQAGYNIVSRTYRGGTIVGLQTETEVELELFPTPALQGQLCDTECIILDLTPFDCPESPADLPSRPDTAQSGYRQTGQAWVWEEGRDRFVFEASLCVENAGNYSFSWERTYGEGCLQRRQVACNYGPLPQPPSNWPCETYERFGIPAE
jgi:hypothetical protein